MSTLGLCCPLNRQLTAKKKNSRNPAISLIIDEKLHCEAPSSGCWISSSAAPATNGCFLGVWIMVSRIVLVADVFVQCHKKEPSKQYFCLLLLSEGIHNLDSNLNYFLSSTKTIMIYV